MGMRNREGKEQRKKRRESDMTERVNKSGKG